MNVVNIQLLRISTNFTACTMEDKSHHLISVSSNLVRPHLMSFSQVFNTSLAEPLPEGYEDVSNIVPPYSAFSAKGQPEVQTCTHKQPSPRCQEDSDG